MKNIYNNIMRVFDKIALSTQIILMLLYLMLDVKLTSLLIENMDRKGFDILYYTVSAYNILGIIAAFFSTIYWIKYLVALIRRRRCINNDKK